MERDATKVSFNGGTLGLPQLTAWVVSVAPEPTVPNPDVRPGPHGREGMRFFDDKADTLVQIIADLIGLLFFFAILMFLLDAIIPN
jgi:hypothetical protein